MSTDDEIIEIRNCQIKMAFWILVSLILTVGGFWALKVNPSDFWRSLMTGIESQKKGWMILLCIILFGGGGLVKTCYLFDRRAQIRISKEGLFCRQWPKGTISWREIKEIHNIEIPVPRSLGLAYIRFVSVTLHTPLPKKKKRQLRLAPNIFKFPSLGDLALRSTLLERSHKDIFSIIQSAHKKYSN